LGREIASDAARGGALLKSYEWAASGVPLAFWLLDLSLLYIAAWGLLRLCPRRSEEPPTISLPLLVAALAGQIVATFASTATVFYFLSAGAAALALIPLWLHRSPVTVPPPPVGRLVIASLAGLVVVLLASPLDVGLASLTGARLLPEAWFPIAVEFASQGGLLIGVLISVVVALACGALGFARVSWVALAPACILVMGPSNPAKGLAATAVVAFLGRFGAGPIWRAGFLIAMTALFVVVSLASL
jgi:hypothetical protein